MMFINNQEPHKTAYTVTVDYRHGTTTGISAHDRALTSRMLAAFEYTQPAKGGGGEGKHTALPQGPTKEDFSRPGHLCPLRYTEGGVRARKGHTEASVGEYE